MEEAEQDERARTISMQDARQSMRRIMRWIVPNAHNGKKHAMVLSLRVRPGLMPGRVAPVCNQPLLAEGMLCIIQALVEGGVSWMILF